MLETGAVWAGVWAVSPPDELVEDLTESFGVGWADPVPSRMSLGVGWTVLARLQVWVGHNIRKPFYLARGQPLQLWDETVIYGQSLGFAIQITCLRD